MSAPQHFSFISRQKQVAALIRNTIPVDKIKREAPGYNRECGAARLKVSGQAAQIRLDNKLGINLFNAITKACKEHSRPGLSNLKFRLYDSFDFTYRGVRGFVEARTGKGYLGDAAFETKLCGPCTHSITIRSGESYVSSLDGPWFCQPGTTYSSCIGICVDNTFIDWVEPLAERGLEIGGHNSGRISDHTQYSFIYPPEKGWITFSKQAPVSAVKPKKLQSINSIRQTVNLPNCFGFRFNDGLAIDYFGGLKPKVLQRNWGYILRQLCFQIV